MISLHGTVVAGEFSRHFDLEIGNEIVGVVGQNGTGKTSLLRTIAGLSALGSGELSLNGVMVDQPAKRLFVLPELRNIGMVFQDHALMPFLSAVDNGFQKAVTAEVPDRRFPEKSKPKRKPRRTTGDRRGLINS